jgi:uncharacterized protein (TIGR02996 family)
MTSDGDVLFRVICEQPQEDTPRLVYADWLEENGQPERAEFIRLQCEAWSLCPQYTSIHKARTRASWLLKKHGDKWYGELPAIPGVEWSSLFVRGFVDKVWLTSSKNTREALLATFAAAPIRYLSAPYLTHIERRELAPLLGRLISVNGSPPIKAAPIRAAEHKRTPGVPAKSACPV